MTALLGPNGAGKTSLLDILATVAVPDAGHVEVNGRVCRSERDARRLRAEIGYLPQPFSFVPSFTALEVVTYTAWLRGYRAERAEVADCLGALGLAAQRGTPMRKLSAGMVQRVGIAAATVGAPPIVVLDEPSSGLDPAQRALFRRYLAGLSGSVVVMSTHLVEDAVSCADRLLVLSAAAIVFDDTPERLRSLGGPAGAEGRAERGYLSLVPEAS